MQRLRILPARPLQYLVVPLLAGVHSQVPQEGASNTLVHLPDDSPACIHCKKGMACPYMPSCKSAAANEPPNTCSITCLQYALHMHKLLISRKTVLTMKTSPGMKWGEEKLGIGCPYCRACRFRDVCLNHTSLDIQYYLGNSTGPLFYDPYAEPHNTFPPDFINTGECNDALTGRSMACCISKD